MPSTDSPRRCARPATCAKLSSPVTYRLGRRAPSAAIACNNRGALPMPGSPPTSTTEPYTRQPTSTRSSTQIPVDVRIAYPPFKSTDELTVGKVGGSTCIVLCTPHLYTTHNEDH